MLGIGIGIVCGILVGIHCGDFGWKRGWGFWLELNWWIGFGIGSTDFGWNWVCRFGLESVFGDWNWNCCGILAGIACGDFGWKRRRGFWLDLNWWIGFGIGARDFGWNWFCRFGLESVLEIGVGIVCGILAGIACGDCAWKRGWGFWLELNWWIGFGIGSRDSGCNWFCRFGLESMLELGVGISCGILAGIGSGDFGWKR